MTFLEGEPESEWKPITTRSLAHLAFEILSEFNPDAGELERIASHWKRTEPLLRCAASALVVDGNQILFSRCRPGHQVGGEFHVDEGMVRSQMVFEGQKEPLSTHFASRGACEDVGNQVLPRNQ